MNQIDQAKERVCKSLLHRVSFYDRLLNESDPVKEKDRVEKLYTYQTTLLSRLERVVTN